MISQGFNVYELCVLILIRFQFYVFVKSAFNRGDMVAVSHYPVMLQEVLDALNPVDGAIYVDGTFGYGGYTQAILDSADCTVIAIDRDKTANKRALALKDKYGDRLIFVHGCFGDVEAILRSLGVEKIDGFVIDIGVSSMQIDDAKRGFSFRFDGALDMRMDNSIGETAADIVNSYDEEALANLIYNYGEERKSRRVAKAIVERRKDEKFKTTIDLADLVRSVVPKSKDGIDSATRTFQALRIAVNDELGELNRALEASERILKSGGRMVVVAFHSLEDGAVKRFFRKKSGVLPSVSRHLPVQDSEPCIVFDLLGRKAIKPSAKEIAENPRSRSARLRAAIRTELLT